MNDKDYLEITNQINSNGINNLKTTGNMDTKCNYQFTNCTVTINEEGKSIDVIREKFERDAKRSEQRSDLLKIIIESATKISEIIIKKPEPLKPQQKSKSKPKTKK